MTAEVRDEVIQQLFLACEEMLADSDRMNNLADEEEIDPKHTPDGLPRMLAHKALKYALEQIPELQEMSGRCTNPRYPYAFHDYPPSCGGVEEDGPPTP